METEEPQPHELELRPGPRESVFELPPVEGRPFADEQAKLRAIRLMIEQARRERADARGPKRPERG